MDRELTTLSQKDRADHPRSPRSPCGLHEWGGHTQDGVSWHVYRGDTRKVLVELLENSFSCAVTSPPYYWQRDYDVSGQIGVETTIDKYVSTIADCMAEVRRVLKKDGLLFLN